MDVLGNTVAPVRTTVGVEPRRWRGLQWWFPLALFLGTRGLNALAITLASARQTAVDHGTFAGMFIHLPKPADPGYLAIITNWDGQWYEWIAVDGYRTPTVGVEDPENTEWAWAFPPLFPMTVRVLMAFTGLSFPLAVTVLNLGLGAVAMWLLYRLLERQGGRFLAVSGVALTSSFISAPLLQAAYSESMGLALLAGIFLALDRKRYPLAVVLVVLLAFTRLITPPLALVALALALHHWRRRRAVGAAPHGYSSLAVLALVAILGVWLWSWVSLALAPTPTGATTRTSLSNGASLGWFADAYRYVGWPGPVLVSLVVMCLLLAAYSRWTRDWGPILRTWLWAYPAYVLAVTPITGGFLRYLLLCPPFALLAAGSSGLMPRWSRIALVATACGLGLILQAVWVSNSLVITTNYLMP